MPESTTDRPTKSHEQVFLLTKSNDVQFWVHRDGRPAVRDRPEPDHIWVHPETHIESTEPQAKPWRRVNLWRGHDYFYDAAAIAEPVTVDREQSRKSKATGVGHQALRPGGTTYDATTTTHRNKRSVWTVATQPYTGAHFAVFPPKLIEPCILAGAPKNACGACGAPWVRTTKRQRLRDGEPLSGSWAKSTDPRRIGPTGVGHWRDSTHIETLGFVPSCTCGAAPVPGVVLDPFCGAGTTGMVAVQHGRAFVGVELSPEYADLGRDRIDTFVRLGFRSPNGAAPVPEDQASLFEVEA